MKTREQWLNEATAIFRQGLFDKHRLPPVHVSISWPGNKRDPRKVIGQYWPGGASADGLGHVFISPVHTGSLEALATLVHELVHACVPAAGHGPEFKKIALDVGLTGKMTATTASPRLQAVLQNVVARIGEIPHPPLNPGNAPTKKQSTRMLKCECAECGYIARTSTQWIETLGPPICPCNQKPMGVK